MTLIAWTDDRVASLKKLWEAGQSASQIANELGGVTKNAVIGKVHRLGLTGRAHPVAERKPRTRRADTSYLRQIKRPSYRGSAVPAVVMEAAPEPVAQPDNIIAFHHPVALMELTDAVCHWPVGDPRAADFFFCGGKAVTGMSYCAHHCRMAYQPPSTPRSQRNGARPGSDLYGWA